MKVLNISMENYRAFEKATLRLTDTVTALVGPNDSGKSTLLALADRICDPWNFRLSDEDKSIFAPEQDPHVEVTIGLEDGEGEALKSALRLRRSAPTEVILEFSAAGVRASTSRPDDSRVFPVVGSRSLPDGYLKSLSPLLPTPIFLPAFGEPMPARFDLQDPTSLLLSVLAMGGLGEDDLPALRRDTPAVRRGLLDSSERLTKLVRQSWTQDRHLEIDIRADGNHLECRVKQGDPSCELWSPVTARGHGLRWFLSFLVRLHSFTREIPTNPLFLFDEPATNLHPEAQRDIRRILHSLCASAHRGQVVYATHSPFMLDWSQPHEVRMLEREEGKSVILNKPYHGGTTLGLWEPFRRNLGLFLGDLGLLDEHNLLVEGPSDQFIIARLTGLLETGMKLHPATRPWSIIPTGDHGSRENLVQLALEHGRHVTVFLDGDESGRKSKEKLIKKWPALEVSTVADILPVGAERKCVDAEDLFDLEWYLDRVNAWYGRFTWFCAVEVGDIDVAESGSGSALKRLFKTRNWGEFSKVDVALAIAELTEDLEEATQNWCIVFERLLNPTGLIWLGLDAGGQRFFVHLVEPDVHDVKDLRLTLLNDNGAEVASWDVSNSEHVEMIDTLRNEVIGNVSEVTSTGRLEVKIGCSEVSQLSHASALRVEISTGVGGRSWSATIPESVALSVEQKPPVESVRVDENSSQWEYKEGDIVGGTVIDTGPYGFIVELENGGTAFNHVSEITGGWVPSVDDYYGGKVEVMVIPPYRFSRRRFDVSMRRASEKKRRSGER